MEQQIVSALPDFQMLDYKIDYINHDQFQKGESNVVIIIKWNGAL